MSLADLVFSTIGVRIGSNNAAAGHDAQILIAALLVLVAKSDGGICPDESLRMVELLRNRFGIMPGEALDLINRASDELAHHAELDSVLEAATKELSLAQKEDLMSMVLKVISADNRKDAAEIRLLAALIEGLDIPDRTMNIVYEQYFAG